MCIKKGRRRDEEQSHTVVSHVCRLEVSSAYLSFLSSNLPHDSPLCEDEPRNTHTLTVTNRHNTVTHRSGALHNKEPIFLEHLQAGFYRSCFSERQYEINTSLHICARFCFFFFTFIIHLYK